MDDPDDRITRLLASSDPGLSEELLPLVYDDLRRIARERLNRERPGQTLQPTALVHEAYLRIATGREGGWENRRHFFWAAAEAMRRILIENARRKRSDKHGGGRRRENLGELELEDAVAAIQDPVEDVLAVADVLESLEAADPNARKLVNLRYFAGFTAQQTADALGMSLRTVEREWAFVRTYIESRLKPADE